MQTALFFFLVKKVADAYISCGVPIGNYIFKKPLFDDRSTNPTVAYSLSVVAFIIRPLPCSFSSERTWSVTHPKSSANSYDSMLEI